MHAPSLEQIRNFRLHSHHLDAKYELADIESIAGACGLQNTPPGVWETALYNRIPDCTLSEMDRLLYEEKSLIQSWSLRGVPVIFPASESDVFLSALTAKTEEPWIYTQGIGLALDFLQMDFQELWEMLQEVMPQLDDYTILSKSTLDQTLADWMLPLLPVSRQELWNQPSMYGTPDKQTVGGAVVSFLLRPCAFSGLVVFGRRLGTSPSFTSYKNWTGHPLEVSEDASKKLIRKYLHCYGPSTVDSFTTWLGCSGRQGRRIWNCISEEIEPVMVSGKKAYILSSDKESLFAPDSLQRELLLLGGHDPFLDQRDRLILQPDKSLHKQIWRLVNNPGAVVYRGEIIGIWSARKKPKGLDIQITLWSNPCNRQALQNLAEDYAVFRQQTLVNVEL